MGILPRSVGIHAAKLTAERTEVAEKTKEIGSATSASSAVKEIYSSPSK